jgi:hypothetical protein
MTRNLQGHTTEDAAKALAVTCRVFEPGEIDRKTHGGGRVFA